MKDDSTTTHLEPRVAKLETAMEGIADDLKGVSGLLKDLTLSVSQQNRETANQIQGLAVAVTNAAAPRRTDWLTLISLASLIVVLIGGVLVYLERDITRNEFDAREQRYALKSHESLELHPVGKSRIDEVERELREKAEINRQNIAGVDAKLQREAELVTQRVQGLIDLLREELRTMQKEGSSGTRERLAVLEDRAGVKSKE